MKTPSLFRLAAMVTYAASLASAALAQPSADRQAKADAMIAKATSYLRAQQDAATGGWAVPPAGRGQPSLPAITGLVLNGLLLEPPAEQTDPAVTNGAKYILSMVHPDGGIYDTILPSYNTSICLSALAKIDSPEAKAAIKPAQDFLRNQQWGSATPVGMSNPGKNGIEAPEKVDPSHPYYGGMGYGSHSRPDISNLIFAIQAWHDSGVPADDEAMQRALVFLQRCQMQELGSDGKVINDQPYAKGSKQGGFIYAPGKDEKSAGQGESTAGTIEESLDDGAHVSRLRAYGTVSYAGFKGYLYAGLSPTDPRVTSALNWIREHYTTIENPELGTDGFYYFAIMMSRALDATGTSMLNVTTFAPSRCTVSITGLPDGTTEEKARSQFAALAKASAILIPSSPTEPVLAYFGSEADAKAAFEGLAKESSLKASMAAQSTGPQMRNWRDDLIDQLARLQNADGSFRSIDDRWMENNPVLITAYSLTALKHLAHEQPYHK